MKSLHNLINKATHAVMQQDRQMKQVISQIVPDNTLAHIKFCRLEAGRLRITVDNAIWVSKIRFSESQIVGALRTTAKLDVVTISLHVAPAQIPVSGIARPPLNRRSDIGAQAITQLASSTALQTDEHHVEQIERSSDASGETRVKANELHIGHGPRHDRPSIVRKPDDRLRQELLKLAATLRKEP